MNQTSLAMTARTESSISASEVKPRRWGEECGQFITRRAEVQGVMCYVLQLGVCLVFLLCLISPAEQHQPPPTPSTRRWSHVVTLWDMRHVTHTWDTGRGVNMEISSHKNTNSELITQVVAWQGTESVTCNVWCGHYSDQSTVTQTRRVFSFICGRMP